VAARLLQVVVFPYRGCSFTAVTRVQIPVGGRQIFSKTLRAQTFFLAGTARMKSFLVAPVRFSDSVDNKTFTHQRFVIFWSRHRF
jgi:hypothetical protein